MCFVDHVGLVPVLFAVLCRLEDSRNIFRHVKNQRKSAFLFFSVLAVWRIHLGRIVEISHWLSIDFGTSRVWIGWLGILGWGLWVVVCVGCWLLDVGLFGWFGGVGLKRACVLVLVLCCFDGGVQ